VLYCSHELDAVEKTCSRVLVLHHGRVVAHDTVERLRDALSERSLEAGRPADAAVLRRIIEVIEMSDHAEDMRKYYSDEAWAELTRRREAMTEKTRDIAMEGTRKWQALFADINASLDEDPAGPKAQALLDRWKALIEEFTGGNQQIKEGMGRAWQDSDNWTPQMKKVREPFGDPRVWEFIRKAGQAREAAGRG